ncbi:MAG: NF038132 family protein [Acidobacteriota bacterium]|nr:NF038132 family protein [Acidobacteriota bacterium]
MAARHLLRTDTGGLVDPSPIPAGWSCTGNCGTDGADGAVTLSPAGSSAYQWVSTSGGVGGAGALPTGALGSETNGSALSTPVFSASAGTALNFYFNYVTSDGGGFADYAWAELFNASNTPIALLFTARTRSSGSIVPGTGLPAPLATLTPASVSIIGGGPSWLPLGSSSGQCWSSGCGYTGWVMSNYTISTAGNYYLKVGVVNWSDQSFDSGLALDGVTVGGVPVGQPTATPTLSSWGMILLGGVLLLFGMKAAVRNATT